MNDATTRFFHISPDLCGGERLVEMFESSGHRAVYCQNGRIATEITYSRAMGRAPLAGWPRARLFSGLFRIGPSGQAPIEAWRDFAFLRRHFPEAVFILTTRDPSGWLLDRMADSGGQTARTYAAHLGISEADLPRHWARDWHDHQRAVSRFFLDDPLFVSIDTERQSPQRAAEMLSRFLPLGRPGLRPGWLGPGRGNIEDRLISVYDHAPGREAGAEDAAFVRSAARFCLGDSAISRPLSGDKAAPAGVSKFYCHWDGGTKVVGRGGKPQPIRIVRAAGRSGSIAVSAPNAHFKLARAERVIADILRLGRSDPVRIDMEDSRWIGADQGTPLLVPVICHNRRQGARNVVLWPLPGLHDIGVPGLEPSGCPDTILFDDKLDRIVWRGMISGSEMRPSDRQGPASHVFLEQLAEAGDDREACDRAWQSLCRTNRLAFVRRWFGHPDFDIGVVMAWSYRAMAKHPLLAALCTNRQPPEFFHRYRYQLCLTGYDHGSNFLSAINSRSVLLKVEDGWEVFYSGLFEPWKHYIPLARYGTDVAEKLTWARQNPDECRRMSRAARNEAARLADPALRRKLLSHILDAIAGAV